MKKADVPVLVWVALFGIVAALVGLLMVPNVPRGGPTVLPRGAVVERTPAPVIASQWTLVNFGAPWCAVCKKLEPELAYFPLEQPNVKYVHVDIEQRASEEFKSFSRYFKGRTVPVTVLIDPSGKAVRQWNGFLSYQEMVGAILKLEQPEPQ